MIKIFIFITKQVSTLGPFKSFFVTTSMETIFLISALICTCLREQYLMLCNSYQYWTMTYNYWNLSCLDIFLLKQKSLLWSNYSFKVFFLNFSYNSFLSILVLKADDIELNPGPNTKSHSYFSCFLWNINSSRTGNYCKFAGLKTCNSVYKYDFLYVSETFLNSPC